MHHIPYRNITISPLIGTASILQHPHRLAEPKFSFTQLMMQLFPSPISPPTPDVFRVPTQRDRPVRSLRVCPTIGYMPLRSALPYQHQCEICGVWWLKKSAISAIITKGPVLSQAGSN